MVSGLPFLRPTLVSSSRSELRFASAYLRFFKAVQCTGAEPYSSACRARRSNRVCRPSPLIQHMRMGHRRRSFSSQQQLKRETREIGPAELEFLNDFLENVGEEGKSSASLAQQSVARSSPQTDLWPRMPKQKDAVDIREFRSRYGQIQRGFSNQDVEVTIRGRVSSIRKLGPGLFFMDLVQDGTLVQCVLSKEKIEHRAPEANFETGIRTGDVISITGCPYRTERNELSISANVPPVMLSKCSNTLPARLKNRETKIQNRCVAFLIEKRGSDILRLRSEVMKVLRTYFELQGFVDVQTPILADVAGGASARPFKTSATEFPSRDIALRIAPELWLKKLIIGGFDKVYEIGPSFRNEGIDQTHNPEFWTCEFYKAFADLDELISMTEKIFSLLSERARAVVHTHLRTLNFSDVGFNTPYRRIDFIPSLEQAIGAKIPPLHDKSAKASLLDVLNRADIRVPAILTLPQILDRLSSRFLESQTNEPTWIINHPECLSPLSKSFEHPENGQAVAARAELFVNKHELVNCYEEENSPFEQRRKFEMQLAFKDPGNHAPVDEGYLEALQWGLPPTGGWGCGIERLVMLFGGVDRIAETLSFGNLRHVVSRSQENSLSPSVNMVAAAERIAQEVDNSSATLRPNSSVVV